MSTKSGTPSTSRLTDWGPMGLKLTSAIARMVMMLFDKTYLEKVANSDLKMLMYERYVDDSNQIVRKANENDSDEETCVKLKAIANVLKTSLWKKISPRAILMPDFLSST